MPDPPPAREIAERIFATASARARAGSPGDDAVAVIATIYATLGASMAPVMGDAGYRAMINRSVRKAAESHPSIAGVVLRDADAYLDPLLARLRDEQADAVVALGVTLFAHFIELLASLIGSELALRLVQRGWPAISESAPDPAEKS